MLKHFHQWQSRKGQTVIELVGVTVWIFFFFGAMFYVASFFDVGQKQTALLRTQAMIELGNHSTYGFSRHGDDKAADAQSQVQFRLGEKTESSRVDLDKIEKFKEAVSGTLNLALIRGGDTAFSLVSEGEARFWTAYQFPKAITRLSFVSDAGEPQQFNATVNSQMAIAHNRSIDVNKRIEPKDYKANTGMFSGSLTFQQYAQVSNYKANLAAGIEDNTTQLKNFLKTLARDDPQIAEEAEALEQRLNLADSVSGGAVAALVNFAISATIQMGFDAISQAFPADAAASAGGAQPSFLDRLFGGYQNGFGAAADAANGGLLSGMANAVTAPARQLASGLGTFSQGLASSNLAMAAQGFSQAGQIAQMGLGYAGVNNDFFNGAVAASGFVGALPGAMNKFHASMGDVGVDGKGFNLQGAIAATQEIATPATQLVAVVAPELAMAANYVNMGLGAAGTVANLPGGFSSLQGAITSGDVSDILQNAGSLVSSVASVGSTVASLTGLDSGVFAVAQLMGGAMSVAGSGIETVGRMKLEGIDIKNPGALASHIVKSNVDGLKENFQSTRDVIQSQSQRVAEAFNQLARPNPVLNAQQKELFEQGQALAKATTFEASAHRVGDAVNSFNLDKLAQSTESVREAALTQMQLAGATEQERAEMGRLFDVTLDGQKALAQTLSPLTPFGSEERAALDARVAAATDAAKKIQTQLDQRFKEDLIAQRQIAGILDGNSQKATADMLLAAGQNYDDLKQMKNEKSSGGLMAQFGGGAYDLKLYQEQTDLSQQLLHATITANKVIDMQKEDQARYAFAVKATEIASQLSDHAPLVQGENFGAFRYGAKAGAEAIAYVLPDIEKSDPKLAQRMREQQARLAAWGENSLDMSGALQAQRDSLLRQLRATHAILDKREEEFQTLRTTLENLQACSSPMC
jgi:hypothetical protein